MEQSNIKSSEKTNKLNGGSITLANGSLSSFAVVGANSSVNSDAVKSKQHERAAFPNLKASTTKHKVSSRPNSKLQQNMKKIIAKSNGKLLNTTQEKDFSNARTAVVSSMSEVLTQASDNASKEQSWNNVKEKRKLLRQNSETQIFRSEANRLERARNDLLRRNTFLSNEIMKAKEEIQNIVPDNKLAELNTRNESLKLEQDDINSQIQSIKEKIRKAEKSKVKVTTELAEATNLLRVIGQEQKSFNQELDRVTKRKQTLEAEMSSLSSRRQSTEGKLETVTQALEFKTKKRISKEKEQMDTLQKVSALKKEALNDEMEYRKQVTERDTWQGTLDEIQEIYSSLKTKKTKSEVKRNFLKEKIKRSQDNLSALKKDSKKVTYELTKAQQNFRKKEEIKSSMQHRNTQTTSRLVIMRDIAWIRVAEEEVLLSPLCGGYEDLSAQDDSSSTPKLPVGAMTPVFEVYNLAPPDNEQASPSKSPNLVKRGHTMHNKRLIDAYSGSEYLWAGEEE